MPKLDRMYTATTAPRRYARTLLVPRLTFVANGPCRPDRRLIARSVRIMFIEALRSLAFRMPASTVPPDLVVRRYRVVAVVGASKNPEKEAFTVPQYLQLHGYEIIPINPTADSIHRQRAYPSLDALPPDVAKQVEVVEVFRPSEELPQVAKQVVEMRRRTGRPFVFWAQTGLDSAEARSTLTEGGVDYVMDACMRVVHQVYGEEGRT